MSINLRKARFSGLKRYLYKLEIEESCLTPPIFLPLQQRYNLEDFEYGRVLGEGTFGIVLYVRLKDTEQKFALKIMSQKLVGYLSSADHTFLFLLSTEYSYLISISVS